MFVQPNQNNEENSQLILNQTHSSHLNLGLSMPEQELINTICNSLHEQNGKIEMEEVLNL